MAYTTISYVCIFILLTSNSTLSNADASKPMGGKRNKVEKMRIFDLMVDNVKIISA